MTRLLRPPELERSRDQIPFEPIREGARHGLTAEIATAIWDHVCIDASVAGDPAIAQRRFHELATMIAARGGRLDPDIGKRTRAETDESRTSRVRSTRAVLRALAPGRETHVARVGDALMASEQPPGREPAMAVPGAQHRRAGLDRYRTLAVQELLGHIGPAPVLRRAFVAAAADPIRAVAGGGVRRSARADPAGLGLWQIAERRATTLFRRAAAHGEVDQDDPAIAAVLQRSGAGQPLPPTLRREMERALGVSLSGVRVHTDAAAAQAVRALGAEAFTLGEDIFFSERGFDPETRAGRMLLAHELTHVTQALEGRTEAAGDTLRVSRPHEPLEREADAMAEQIGNHAAREAPTPGTSPLATDNDTTTIRGATREPRARSASTTGRALQRKPDPQASSLVPQVSVVERGTTTQIIVLGQIVATAEFPGGQTTLLVQDRWEPATGVYSLSIDSGLGGQVLLRGEAIAALNRMVPHLRGSIVAREQKGEAPSHVFVFARFGRGAPKTAAPAPASPSAQPAAPAQDTPPVAPGDAAKSNPYAAFTVDQRADVVRKMLDKWLTGRDILQVFQACDHHDFVALQRKVDLAAVIEKLNGWQVVQLAALGPILASQRQQVNRVRADLLVDITHSWGPERAQLFAHYMFSTMPTDDATSVLRSLAGDQHLHDTIDRMPLVGELLDDRGIDRSHIRDRDWEWLDIPRGIGAGLSDVMSTSEAARKNEGIRAQGMGQDLPSPYREEVESVDRSALERALTHGNIVFGAFDHATMGLLSTAKGVVYDTPKSVASGIGEIADGHVAAGVEQLTGPTIFIVGVALGIRAYRKSVRLTAMLELTEEGQALYGTLRTRIGAQGIDKVARWVQDSSEAQILVRDEGAAGIQALYRAQGNVAAARAELATTRAGAAKPTTPPVAPSADSPVTAPPPASPANRTVDASNKVARSSNGYRLNRKHIENYEKIKGEPESLVEADANREALAAELAASKSSIKKVYLGREADQLINGSQGKAISADVVAVNRRAQYLVYEAKGMNIEHGLEQLDHTARELGPSNVVRQTLVVPERINTPGYTVKNGILHLGGKPALVAGKPVNVIFSTQK